MFKANLYSPEPLTLQSREALHDGVDIVAAHMGETVFSRELTARLPFNSQGKVNPLRVGVGNLDPMVELHIFAIPMDLGAGEASGLSALGHGTAFVDTSEETDGLIRTSTAHEVSHALGFVLDSAEQSDPSSEYHCADRSCIMHRAVTISLGFKEIQTEESIEASDILSRIRMRKKDRSITVTEHIPTFMVKDQNDFCIPCKRDLKTYGERQLNELRYSRLVNNRVAGNRGSK